ncbi:hypothetical protein DFH29DRAFT_981710 [Suillus ampliporus]|nr:hypothetical protein DFH29DRAFT_981710 [Suillus ampliporus]
MARLHRVSLYWSILISIYLLVLFEVLPMPLIAAGIAQEILLVIPWWLLVSFGSYSLWSLGWEYLHSVTEINEAKTNLRGRAVTVD